MDERSLGESFKRHLQCDRLSTPTAASDRQRFAAIAAAQRKESAARWRDSERAYEERQPKRIYYLSLEYLLGRSLRSHLANLRVDEQVRAVLAQRGIDLQRLCEAEPDARLGNGGLGRLAACFLDSMATLHLPAIGYGLRYKYGIFRQTLASGWQVEHPDNGLRRADPQGTGQAGAGDRDAHRVRAAHRGGWSGALGAARGDAARRAVRSPGGGLRRADRQYAAPAGGELAGLFRSLLWRRLDHLHDNPGRTGRCRVAAGAFSTAIETPPSLRRLGITPVVPTLLPFDDPLAQGASLALPQPLAARRGCVPDAQSFAKRTALRARGCCRCAVAARDRHQARRCGGFRRAGRAAAICALLAREPRAPAAL